MSNYSIVFLDLAERDRAEYSQLKYRQFTLQQMLSKDGGLPEELMDELLTIYAQFAIREQKKKSWGDRTVPQSLDAAVFTASVQHVVGQKAMNRAVAGALRGLPPRIALDPLFWAVQQEMKAQGSFVDDHDEGLFPSQVEGLDPSANPQQDLTPQEKLVAAVYGILTRDSITDPSLGRRFYNAISLARGEYSANQGLFDRVLEILIGLGNNEVTYRREVRAAQWAQVVATLVLQGVQDEKTSLLTLRVEAVLSGSNGGNGDNVAPSSIDIDLPDLEAVSDREIVRDNLLAMQALYFSAMLDELQMFQVVDKLVELFMYGQLPVGRGRAGDQLYQYWKKSVNRMTEVERRNLYSRAFGLAGGDAMQSGLPNREFEDLKMRFVSAVVAYTRQVTVDELLRSRSPLAVTVEQVKKSGRDLAQNLSLHAYGIAYFAATELQNQVKEMLGLLNEEEIKGAYGAKDPWQVIEQVSATELPQGSRNSVKYRSLATSGAIIIRWLADHSSELSSPTTIRLLNIDDITSGAGRPKGVSATSAPTDRDLVNACETLIATTGTSEDTIGMMAQAQVSPATMTSRPIQIPAVARDLLESVGVKAPYVNGGTVKSQAAGR